MRKSVFRLVLVALSLGGLGVAAPALAADYYQPPQQVYVPPPAPSCCCPTVRRGLFTNFSFCGQRHAYVQYPQYQQPYPGHPHYQHQQPYPDPAYYPQQPYPAYQPYQQPAYYQPGYAPEVGVGVGIGPVGIGVGVRHHRQTRRDCWRTASGRLICR